MSDPVCDLCTIGARGVWNYPAHDIVLDGALMVSLGGWFACETCHALVAAGDWAGLEEHAFEALRRRIDLPYDLLRAWVRESHQQFRSARYGEPRRVAAAENSRATSSG